MECKNSSGTDIGCSLVFNDSGFILDIATQTSCVTSSDITISAVQKSTTSNQCIPFFDSKSVPLKFWAAYSDPNTGTQKAMLNYSSTDYLLDTASTGTDVTLVFDSNGEAKFSLTYPDAGKLNLRSPIQEATLPPILD